MIRRLAALALLVAGAVLHAQTQCGPGGGRALFHISEFPSADGPSTAVYIKLANKTLLEFLRREQNGKPVYVPAKGVIRTKLVEQFGEPCIASNRYNGADDLFVESSLRETLKQLTGTDPADVGEVAAPFQSEIQSQKSENERQGKPSEPQNLPRAPQAADEYSWAKYALFFFVGMLATGLVVLVQQRFFRKAEVPVSADDVRRLLSDSEVIRNATQSVAESLSHVSAVTPEEIADAVAERLKWGQTQLGTVLNLLARLPFHPRYLSADLIRRFITAAEPSAHLLSQEEADVLVTRQRFEDVRRQAIEALGLVRHAFDGLGINSHLRALLNERSLAAMYQYADEGLSGVNLTNAIESGGVETAISVFRRLHRGELLLSTYVIPVLPESEVAMAALLLRSLQVAVNEMWVLLYLMGIQPDELVLLRQPPPDAEVKLTSNALGTIRERFRDVSRLLEQPTLSGKAVCDFEEIGYSFNNKRQRRSVVYELALNKPPREAASKPEPVAPQESPRLAPQVVTTVRKETKPAEITAPPQASLPITLDAVPPEAVSLRQLLASGTVSALSREDERKWAELLDNTATYRDGIWQVSQFCGTLFRKGDIGSAAILMDALKKCGVIFKDAVIGEPAAVQPDFDKEPYQKVMSQSLITEAEVKAVRLGAVVKRLVPFIEFDGKVLKGLVVVH